ncbi:MAG: altronate dehydratase [Bacteroidetes bacterium]|nr:altronate dehydratase [Bacteroidota bacterium]
MTPTVTKIRPNDSVCVAVAPIEAGTVVTVDGTPLTVLEPIELGHKIALKEIAPGEGVYKFGVRIGRATQPIAKGAWVHAHNLKTDLEGTLEYSYTPQLHASAAPAQVPSFMGYRRPNGKVGTRNEIWIINSVGCVNRSAERISQLANQRFVRDNFDGVFSFSHPFGCSQLGDDLVNTRAVLGGLARNPNAGAVLVLGLGCENLQLDQLIKSIPDIDPKRLRFFNSQKVADEIEEGLKAVEELFEAMKDDRREPVPVSELTIGVKCGGSDGFSGITANPLVGRITDALTSYNGSVLQTEVPEMFGAEQLLMNRAASRKVFDGIVALINNFKEYFLKYGQPVYENPSPGNKAGGITTLEEKSLGAIQKGGNAVITEVLEYGQPITQRGLVLVNAPGNDGVSSTAMTASGATILLFTTGRGTPLGFPVPTIKISTNSAIHAAKPGWIDFNAGKLLDGQATFESLTDEFMTYLLDVASGRIKTKNEVNGYKEIAIWKTGVTL